MLGGRSDVQNPYAFVVIESEYPVCEDVHGSQAVVASYIAPIDDLADVVSHMEHLCCGYVVSGVCEDEEVGWYRLYRHKDILRTHLERIAVLFAVCLYHVVGTDDAFIVVVTDMSEGEWLLQSLVEVLPCVAFYYILVVWEARRIEVIVYVDVPYPSFS